MGKRFAVLGALVLLGCAELILPAEAIQGEWGGPEASLTLTAAGGTTAYPCGAGTIDPGWSLDVDGSFLGTGEHSFGGGPEPIQGRESHRATYLGRVSGKRLTLTVVLTDLGDVLGPFRLTRGGELTGPRCL